MKKLTILLAFGLLIAVPASDSFAAGKDMDEKFEHVDNNNDGKISKSEFENYKMKKFEKCDKNDDNMLDKSEFKGMISKNYDHHEKSDDKKES